MYRLLTILCLFFSFLSYCQEPKGSKTPLKFENLKYEELTASLVHDAEKLFSSTETKFLDSVIAAFENKTIVDITICTIDSFAVRNGDFDDYINKLARVWKFMKHKDHKGIIIAISRNFNKIKIGYDTDIENLLGDYQTKKIVDSFMRPLFVKWNYFECAKQGLFEIIKILLTKDQISPFSTLAAIDASFPLCIEKIDFNDKRKLVQLNDGVLSKIRTVINDYYFNECSGSTTQSYFSMNDVYFNTIQLHSKDYTIYVVILKHMPGAELTSKLIFYNNISKQFIDSVVEFNISALYDYRDKKIIPSGLKKALKIQNTEIKLIDYDKDGMKEYGFSRLYHNGTANAIETFILKVSGRKIEKLEFKRQFL